MTNEVGGQESDADRAAALHERAIELRSTGDFAAAEEACREAITLFERSAGTDTPDVANALVEQSRLLQLLDRLPEAVQAITRALAILRPILGQDPTGNPTDANRGSNGNGAGAVTESASEQEAIPPDVREELVRLLVLAEATAGGAERARGDLAASETAFRRALELCARELPPDDLLHAGVMNNLAVTHKFQGRYDDAEELYRRALEITERAPAESEDARAQDLATLYHNLGGIAHARGDFAKGEPLARKSVELREAMLGADHPLTAADRAAWGALLEGVGRLSDAETAYRDALGVFETRLGHDSLEAAATLTSLGGLLHARGELEEAEQVYRRAVRIRQHLLGSDHFDLALTLNNLAMVLADREHTAEAAPLAARAVGIFTKVLGPDHPHTQKAVENARNISAAASG